MKITLYHYWRSSASWRVRWGLALKNIPYEAIAIDLLTSEEKSETYLKKNPSGYVPTLVVDHHVMGESVAILEWLDENYPLPALLPKDSFERATARRLAETINSGIQPLQNLDVQKMHSTSKETQKEWMQHWVRRGLKLYEQILIESGKESSKFSLGDSPSFPDLFLIPQMYSAYRNDIQPSEFPLCNKIYQNALLTKACEMSAPDSFKP